MSGGETPLPEPGWVGELALRLEAAGGRTVLVRRHQRGPLQVQRPFYPEADGTCHIYLLHPPGGLVGGDRLSVEVHLAPASTALVTTPAANKLYRSAGAQACQAQLFKVEKGAALEWLPQETIVFDGARAKVSTRVELASQSTFLGWEILCLGRPACGERFAHGELRTETELFRDGRPLWLERLRIEGSAPVLDAAWGFAGWPVSGTLLCTGVGERVVAAVRDAVRVDAAGETFAATCLDGLLVCRYLGAHAERARQRLEAAWQVLRPAVLGRQAEAPRIWRT
jgi:urease accessory protein